jgi:hypothetical protein
MILAIIHNKGGTGKTTSAVKSERREECPARPRMRAGGRPYASATRPLVSPAACRA